MIDDRTGSTLRMMRIAASLCTVIGLTPLVIGFASVAIASWAGCRLDEGNAHPCIVLGNDFGERLYDGAMMFWLFFLTAPVGCAALVLWAILLVQALRRRAARRRAEGATMAPLPSGDLRGDVDADTLGQEWATNGRFVLREEADTSDHESIDAWLSNLLDRRPASAADDHVRSLVYHSLNFDIPFEATRRVREELIAVVRERLAGAEPPDRS